MLLHIGDDMAVRLSEIVAIIDANVLKSSPAHQRILGVKYGRGVVGRLLSDDVKSVVITTDGIYPSPISSVTLRKRAESWAVESLVE